MMTKTSPTECVCVWLDTASEPGRKSWIVSHDRLNADGTADSSATLSALDADDCDEAVAIEEARSEGERLGLPVYHQGEAKVGQGFPRLLFPAPAAAE